MAMRIEGCLVWEDLTVHLPTSKTSLSQRMLLDGLTGSAQPGRILVLMGPSGCGKTTFLDSLSGRLPGNVTMSGKVTLNGKALRRRDVSYVPQEDVFIGTLTVRETLLYSAHLRLPPTKTNEEMENSVDDIIEEMGLQDCANTRIGNWHLRGISGGEKKRLSIGLSLITQPYVFLLDEPTSGLDSAAAFYVTRALKNVADEGRIVVFSVHQPSSEAFELFDDLLLISGGDVVFFGDANLAIKFFADSGFPCPPRRSPCEHFLRCINSDFDRVMASLALLNGRDNYWEHMKTSEIRSILIQKYKQSPYASRERIAMTKDIILTQDVPRGESSNEANPGRWKQLYTLTSRSFTNMYRDIGYYWLRMAFYISVSISVGTLFSNLGTDYRSLITREACDKFIYGFMICLSGGGIPFFTEEMKVFYHERSNGDYSEAVFVLSNFISSFPFVAATSSLSATVLYYMLKFKQGLSYFAFLQGNLYGGIAVMEGCMMVSAAVVPHMFMATLVGTAFTGIMMISSSFLEPLPSIPKLFWRYPLSYISFTSWAMEGQLKNDLLGIEFGAMVPGGVKQSGETVVRGLLGGDVDHSKWWDMAIVILISFCYRLLFYLLLKFKGPSTTSLSIPTTWFRKTSLKRVGNRNHPPHSMSSQQGLGSPLP